MTRIHAVAVVVIVTCIILIPLGIWAGGPAGRYAGPPLDPTLMAFKEQGVWYFPCTAPVYPHRIPPHYLTYGPPPPPCPPPPVAHCAPPAPRKIR